MTLVLSESKERVIAYQIYVLRKKKKSIIIGGKRERPNIEFESEDNILQIGSAMYVYKALVQRHNMLCSKEIKTRIDIEKDVFNW